MLTTRKGIEYFAGCLIGGAVGDALGAPVEFWSLAQIRQRIGITCVQEYIELNAQGLAEFTDDTQMTLFTAEGLMIALNRGKERGIWNPAEAVHQAYLRWYQTQRKHPTDSQNDLPKEGWLLNIPEIWKVKAPGNTCLSALGSGKLGSLTHPLNNSKGCGGVMRVAPVGLLFRGEEAFNEGVKVAALTHGHPSGYLSAGCLAQIIAEIIARPSDSPPAQVIREAISEATLTLSRWPGHSETLQAVQASIQLVDSNAPDVPETLEKIGGGWVGEEALAIAIFCALSFPENYAAGVSLSVTHSGDSDSTGAICGNLLGALLGQTSIPAEWLEQLDLREEIERIARLFLE